VVALVSLDVQAAFDAAWWSGILRELRKCDCHKNLYKLTRNYFSQRTAVLSSNCLKVEKAISRGCPQGVYLWSWVLEPAIQLTIGYAVHG
jgi:hypothetical protein